MPAKSSSSRLPARFAPANLPLRLAFGAQRTTLRALEPGDTGALIEFFASHSEETIHRRYGYARVLMTPEQASRLVNVDQTRDAALGVFERFDGALRLIAIGRYCLGLDGRWAEVAFVVHEERRALGIGTTLLVALTAIARERGLERLVAEVEQDNVPMLQILRRAGATIHDVPQTSCVEATLFLGEPSRGVERRSSSRGRK